MISVNIKEKLFGGITILNDTAFDLAPGETLAVTGASGIGKTTLLRILAGLDLEFEGKVSTPAKVAMVFQEPVLLPWRSAADNVRIAAHVTEAAAVAALGEVGLDGRGADFPGQLSLGQQRRLALARALAVQPHLLLLDEPFVSLDQSTVDEMMRLTERLLAARDFATVLVTHSQREAERLATRVLHLG